MSVSLFKKKGPKPGHDELGKIPPPGTPPTKDELGNVTDPGNPWIGPIDPKLGYPTEGYSGKQRRRIWRAQARRINAERRTATKAYAKAERRRARFVAFAEQRARIINGEVFGPDPDLTLHNAVADNERRQKVTRAFDTQAARQATKEDRRQDWLDQRRIARFKAGKPRGKDLREDVMNQYSSFLPPSYWAALRAAGRYPKTGV